MQPRAIDCAMVNIQYWDIEVRGVSLTTLSFDYCATEPVSRRILFEYLVPVTALYSLLNDGSGIVKSEYELYLSFTSWNNAPLAGFLRPFLRFLRTSTIRTMAITAATDTPTEIPTMRAEKQSTITINNQLLSIKYSWKRAMVVGCVTPIRKECTRQQYEFVPMTYAWLT